MNRSYQGLTLAAPTGALWRWIGSAVAQRRGAEIRVERWQAQCPRCGERVIVRARLSSGLRQQFYSRRAGMGTSSVEIRIALPGDTPGACSRCASAATTAAPELFADLGLHVHLHEERDLRVGFGAEQVNSSPAR